MDVDRSYKPVKESRGWYFVEYYPANKYSRIAVLNLVVTTEPANKNDIINVMEKELRDWIRKYPVPLLVYAYDEKEDRYNFNEINNIKI